MEQDVALKPHRLRNALIAAGIIGLLLVGVVVATLWLVGRDRDGATAAFEAGRVDASTLPQTVPFRMVANHLVVDAVIGDEGEVVPMMLDTGAPLIISDDVADRFGGEAKGSMSTVAIDGTIVKQDVVPVAKLRLGDAVFEDVAAIKGFIDDDNPLSCISRNGLLGASLMKDAVWQIDYVTGEVTISSSVDGLDHVDGAITIPFFSPTDVSPSPQIVVGAGDASATFLLDTGSDGGLTLNPADLEAIGLEVDAAGPAYDVRAAGAAGTYDARVLYSPVDIGLPSTYLLEDYPVATLESLAEGQGNIGNAFLGDFVVTIDWPNDMLYLDPVSPDPGPPLPASAALSWDGEQVIVGNVVEGTDAATAGLAVGQVVSSIDGRDVSAASRDDYCELVIAGSPESFELTTVGGESYEIETVTDFFDWNDS